MEVIAIDAIIEAVIFAVRKDLVACLMDMECCQYSKKKIRKIGERLRKREADMETIEEAKLKVRSTIRQSLSSLEKLEEEPVVTDDDVDSIVKQFMKRITSL